MTAFRSTKENRFYTNLRKERAKNQESAGCVFCEIQPGHSEHVKEYKFYRVIKNFLPYSLWDDQAVADHLMITPINHTDKLGTKNPAKALEFLKIVEIYEASGYNIYARAPTSKIKSVVHQHTHLIKPRGDRKKFLFMLRKPFYIRLSV